MDKRRDILEKLGAVDPDEVVIKYPVGTDCPIACEGTEINYCSFCGVKLD